MTRTPPSLFPPHLLPSSSQPGSLEQWAEEVGAGVAFILLLEGESESWWFGEGEGKPLESEGRGRELDKRGFLPGGSETLKFEFQGRDTDP